MKHRRHFLLVLLLLGLLAASWPVLAQTPPPATPTQPPAILVIQPTPPPAPTPRGSLLRQVLEENKKIILLGLITALIAGILVGVFIRQFAESIARNAGRLFHLIFDRFASAPLLSLRYERRYRQTLAGGLQTLASSNIVNREVRLDRVYVPVALTEETLGGGTATFEDLIQWDEDRRRRQRQRAVEPWEAVRRFSRLVVMGEPGAGKTTYLAHLAFLCARRERLPGYLPLFIRLRDVGSAGSLEEILPGVLAGQNFPNGERFIRRKLDAGRCLILLDGLDEVDSQAQHQQAVQLVQAFADRHVPRGDRPAGSDNIVVVSCRTYSYEHGPQLTGFVKTMVMDFDDSTIEQFVHSWFDREDLNPLAGGLLQALGTNRRFKELARNPLLLLLIVTHFERERSLPTLRAELYDQCIETRIARWNDLRGTHRGRFGRADKRRMLRELALDVYRQERRGLLDEETLLEWLGTFMAGLRLPDSATPAEFLDEVVRASGLIQERAIGRYGFSHLTLQEYFAAEGVARLGRDEGAALLGDHLASPRWHEIILLYCGLADHADPLLRRIVRRAQDESGRDAETWLQAGRCLAEGAKDVAPAVCRQVAAGLLALLRAEGSDEGPGLTGAQSGESADLLSAFAAEALPAYVRDLLDGGRPQDILLAARLLPAGAGQELRAEVSRRVAELTRSGETGERRAASAALGWVAEARPEALAALRDGLADPDPAARAEAARALGRLRNTTPGMVGAADGSTLTALTSVYETDAADAARHAALEALLALGCAARVGMIPVPAGEFPMGSPADDPEGKDDERPQHRVYVPAFYLDRTPVTNAAFRRFLQAGGYARPEYWKEAIDAGRWQEGKFVDYGSTRQEQPRYWDDPTWNGDEQPVVGVSWYEALAYARWAGKRLPTEAEWEKAARWDAAAGRARRYPWGDAWDGSRANIDEAGIQRTTPVSAYSPAGDSPCGAADMAGNVFEWCQSGYRPYPYDPNDGREALGGGDDVTRVLRGGSWYTDKDWGRCARRYWNYPGYWGLIGGFRCCCATASPPSGSGS